jgi:peptidoglycan hydrolase-like protein with peptidoglycan-binding domain
MKKIILLTLLTIIISSCIYATCKDLNEGYEKCGIGSTRTLLNQDPEQITQYKIEDITALLKEDSDFLTQFFVDNPQLLSTAPEAGNTFLESRFGIPFTQDNGQIISYKTGPPQTIITQTGASLSGNFIRGTVSIVKGIITLSGLTGTENSDKEITIEEGTLEIKDENIAGTIIKGTIDGIPITNMHNVEFRPNGEIKAATIVNGQFGQFYGDFTIQYHAGFIHFAGQDNRITKISTEEYKEQMRITGSFIVKTEHMKDMKTADIVAEMDTTITIEKEGTIDSIHVIDPKESLIGINFDPEKHDKAKSMVTFYPDSENIMTASGSGDYSIKSYLHIIDKIINEKSSPEEIKKLQRILRQLGYYTWTNSEYPEGIDGVWGSGTEKAINQFIENHFNPENRALLFELLNEFASFTITPGDTAQLTDFSLAKGSKGETVKTAQKLLRKLGHYTWSSPKYPEGLDGIYGGGTKDAVISFQKSVGIEPTGIIDFNTREALEEKTGDSFEHIGTCTLSREGNNIKINTEGIGTIKTQNQLFMTFDGKKKSGININGVIINNERYTYEAKSEYRPQYQSSSETLDFDALAAQGYNIDLIKAIMAIESNGKAFDDEGHPFVRFECHLFNRWSSHKVPCTIRSGRSYSTVAAETNKAALLKAMELDKDAAIRSSSFGVMQVLGDNYKALGYDSPTEFYEAMFISQAEQEKAFINQVMNYPSLRNEFKKKYPNFSKVARLYNGPGYRQHAYHTKLAQKYTEQS